MLPSEKTDTNFNACLSLGHLLVNTAVNISQLRSFISLLYIFLLLNCDVSRNKRSCRVEGMDVEKGGGAPVNRLVAPPVGRAARHTPQGTTMGHWVWPDRREGGAALNPAVSCPHFTVSSLLLMIHYFPLLTL